MIKTLSKAQKMEREKFRIPRSVQDAIPIRRIFADGIFQVGNQYSKTWSFTDINYAIASKEDKTAMFLDYSELLNALDSGASAKITIYNRRINKAEFEKSVLLPDKADGLDEYRHEFNKMLTAQVTGTSNSIVRERYLTVSVVKRNADEARSYFARVGTDLVTHLAQLSSVATELTLTERLHIFRDFFKAGEQAAAEFNIHEHARRGQHFKDWFCPDSMEFAADHFKLDARYGRVLYLQDYASYIKDSFVSELCDLDRDLMLSIDIQSDIFGKSRWEMYLVRSCSYLLQNRNDFILFQHLAIGHHLTIYHQRRCCHHSIGGDFFKVPHMVDGSIHAEFPQCFFGCRFQCVALGTTSTKNFNAGFLLFSFCHLHGFRRTVSSTAARLLLFFFFLSKSEN